MNSWVSAHRSRTSFFFALFFALGFLYPHPCQGVSIAVRGEETLRWDREECLGLGADLIVRTQGLASGRTNSSASLELVIKNFRSVWANAKGDGVALRVDHKTVGSVRYTNPIGETWGDLHLPDLRTVCDLNIDQPDTTADTLSIHGRCQALGDIAKQSGPRVHFDIDQELPFRCANPFLKTVGRL